MLNLVFWENKKKSNCRLLKILLRVLSVKQHKLHLVTGWTMLDFLGDSVYVKLGGKRWDDRWYRHHLWTLGAGIGGCWMVDAGLLDEQYWWPDRSQEKWEGGGRNVTDYVYASILQLWCWSNFYGDATKMTSFSMKWSNIHCGLYLDGCLQCRLLGRSTILNIVIITCASLIVDPNICSSCMLDKVNLTL